MASCRTRVRSRRRGSARHLAKVRFTKVSGRFFANSEMANPRRGIRVKFTVTYVAEWHWRMRAHVDAWKLDQTGILRVRHVVDASIDLPVPVLCILGIVSQSTAQKELSRLSAHVRYVLQTRSLPVDLDARARSLPYSPRLPRLGRTLGEPRTTGQTKPRLTCDIQKVCTLTSRWEIRRDICYLTYTHTLIHT
jgi:hypothetical protein